ncbi:hypothetical protein KNP414_04862 [Paenibacillus mucilaginosus KNP414]|uniref:Uncharacterized protein n=1 Tax=Paenibacillus mucilaginosus (strain KNP414) TaxID=1036673 RepID=F8FJQ7_PAEMK|nr:hypothetical protein KNP414_04862 [Paenibacillus mucilaginosus KNP414]
MMSMIKNIDGDCNDCNDRNPSRGFRICSDFVLKSMTAA